MTENIPTNSPVPPAFSEAEVNEGKTMAILAYIFFIIPLLAARENRFAMYHTEQAIVLWIVFFIIYLIVTIFNLVIAQISSTLSCMLGILTLIPWIFFLILWIMGLINAASGKAQPLPVIGQYATKLNLYK